MNRRGFFSRLAGAAAALCFWPAASRIAIADDGKILDCRHRMAASNTNIVPDEFIHLIPQPVIYGAPLYFRCGLRVSKGEVPTG